MNEWGCAAGAARHEICLAFVHRSSFIVPNLLRFPMLSEKHLQLLTAYVDGELSPRQLRRVSHLVEKSAEARQLLHDLGKDSRQLAALPRKLPPRDLPRRVLRQAAEVPAPVPATPSTLAPVASGMPSWIS